MTDAVLDSFRHEARLYAGPEDFAGRLVPFIRAGVRAGEPVMVAVTVDKIALLRDALGDDARGVRFEDMAVIGANPARIIPAWQQFIASCEPGRPARGVGEPIWSGRTASELAECQVHEALLNVAFEEAERFHLVCPYDLTTLGEDVIHEARCSHPIVYEEDQAAGSAHYRGIGAAGSLEGSLPGPPPDAAALAFGEETLRDVRSFVRLCAERVGLGSRTDDVLLAVHELATNTVRHGGSRGVLRVWQDEGLVAEIEDVGHIRDPLVGRRAPADDQVGGWGLWIANQVCDLVQLRSGPGGTTVRVLVRPA